MNDGDRVRRYLARQIVRATVLCARLAYTPCSLSRTRNRSEPREVEVELPPAGLIVCSETTLPSNSRAHVIEYQGPVLQVAPRALGFDAAPAVRATSRAPRR